MNSFPEIPQLDKVCAALAKAQKAFAPALKSNTNPHFKSKYADLAACVEAVIDALNENEIFLLQRTHEDETGVTVETIFCHASGQQLSGGKLHFPASKQDPQGYMAALTYARRGSLMAACGHAPEDTDGNNIQAPKFDRTRIMKVSNAIAEHLSNGREFGALQEWQDISGDVDLAGAVWARLTTPERKEITRLQNEAAAKDKVPA